MTDINMHRVVSIRPNVNVFDGFTVYSWVGTDDAGQSVSVSFFHRHESELVYHPTTTGDYTTMKIKLPSEIELHNKATIGDRK
jgi:hypothetical protein